MQPTQKPTWIDLLPAYLGHLKRKRRSPRTIELRTYHVKRFFTTTGLLPHDVTLDDLRAWMENPNWAASTCQVVRSSLGSFFAYLDEEDLVTPNPAKRLEAPKIPVSKPKPATDDDVARALAKADERVRLMVTLGMMVGLRAMEIAAVHSDDVVLTSQGATLRVVGKGSKTRIIPLMDDVAALLMSDEPRYLFPGRIAGHISPAYVSRLVSKVLPLGVTCHKLRHRFATLAYRGSGNIRVVQELLGHASVATTQVYVSVDNEELRQAVMSVAA